MLKSVTTFLHPSLESGADLGFLMPWAKIATDVPPPPSTVTRISRAEGAPTFAEGHAIGGGGVTSDERGWHRRENPPRKKVSRGAQAFSGGAVPPMPPPRSYGAALDAHVNCLIIIPPPPSDFE